MELNRQIKYLRIDDELHIGYVEFHRHLLPKDIRMTNDPRIKGGGMISLDVDAHTLCVYGTSSDFGDCDKKFVKQFFQDGLHLEDFFLGSWIERFHKKDIADFFVIINGETIFKPNTDFK